MKILRFCFSLLLVTGLSLILGVTATLMASTNDLRLGQNEALRTYIEFADGSNRGIFSPETGKGGLPDEDYDATTAMVINWHRKPETSTKLDAVLKYRKVHPFESQWVFAKGVTFDYWYREEKINRVVLRDLTPNSVYEYQVAEDGEIFRFRTMPSSLEERPVTLVMTGDHQSPGWDEYAHNNARMAALIKPDMFVVAGDFVNCEGEISESSARRWATYLDYLYGVDDGYFFYEKMIDGHIFDNLVIPHIGILGNHEIGERHHLRWPGGVMTGSSEPGYPFYRPANWMELLFHWPFRSEGFYSELTGNHPNVPDDQIADGFGHGGFGALHFSDYLLLIGLDTGNQNWEGLPPKGLRDWDGRLITDQWPWFETHHAGVRQDLWLKNLLEPKHGPNAGEVYDFIIPVLHRGLFGPTRKQMTLKNRSILELWLPVFYRNNVKFIKEAHEHLYARSVPMGITTQQPENTYIEKIYYNPHSWELSDDLAQDYIDYFHGIDVLRDHDTDIITGWHYKGYYITFTSQGMRAFGHGGWAAGRRRPGDRGGGNAGLWFVDESKGGKALGGAESYHLNVVRLSPDGLTTEAFQTYQLENFENGNEPMPLHRITWCNHTRTWSDQ